MSINFSTNSEFIKKLSKIVEANLTDENFGVKELAQKTRISRTLLHRKLKSINNQSVSQFIREIRLNKAKEMLQQELSTVSEIAYKVGFGSPSYFTKCFHDYFGYPPGVLKNVDPENAEIKNRSENSKQNGNKNPNELIKKSSVQKGVFGKLLLTLLGILTIVVIAIFVYKNILVRKTNSIIKDKSIAVLPLKNLSGDTDIQYLANGIMEDILNRLAHVDDFKVKSRISSENYSDPNISLPEIAKEMDVSFILEGSIINNGDKVRIYVQLIDAVNDIHIWSDEYNQDLTDILSFITEVSKQIAEELQFALTSGEIEKIEKNYTNDNEAYNLYLLGRYFWHQRTVEDMNTSVKYFNQALARDSNYSLAYAGLADAYNSLSWYGGYPTAEGFHKCREYAIKAISIDKNLAEAHAALGDVAADYFWDWELAEKELRLAIKLNPNFALTYKYYADYLRIMGKNREARLNIDKAIELNPQSLPLYQSSARCYYRVGNFDKALKDIEKILEFQKSNSFAHKLKFRIYFHQGEDSKAIEALLQYLLIKEPEKNYGDKLIQIYTDSGINGIVQWYIEDCLNKKPNVDYLSIAISYAMLGDKDSALEYLEELYKTGHTLNLPRIKDEFYFEILHGNPRFTALLEKMNLADK